MTPARNYILVVEDEPQVREAIRDILELEGFNVATAENGAEALNVLAGNQRLCLILLDLMMPVMNGWQFLEEAERSHAPIVDSIPIVVVSAVADLANLKLRQNCSVMNKPVEIAKLLEIARNNCDCA